MLVAALLAICCLATIAAAEPFGGGNNNNGGSSSTSSSSNGGGGVGIHIGGGINLGLGELQRCPKVCTCTGPTVDCSNRGLVQVPRRIPLDTERL